MTDSPITMVYRTQALEAESRVAGPAVLRICFAAILVLGGCDDTTEPSGGPIPYHAGDSAGVRITETSSGVLGVVLPWVIHDEPELELGSSEGGPSEDFHQIRGLTIVGDDNLVVVDAGSHELRWFDRTGTHLLTVGGEGRGPGEFTFPHLVRQFGGDSILVADRTLRLTWIAPDGTGHRIQPVATDSRGLMVGHAVAARGERVLFQSLTTPCSRGEFCEPDRVFSWVDVAQASSHTVTRVRSGMISTLELGELPHLLESPFHSVGASSIGPDGPVVEGGAGYELLRFASEGRLAAIHRINARPQPADDEVVDRAVRRFVDRGMDPDPWRRAYAAIDLPESLPAFRAIQVDRLGWIWAERFRLVPGDPAIWVVFDPEGRAQGVIELPAGLEVHEIGEHYVLGRWTDDLGRELVRRHALERVN